MTKGEKFICFINAIYFFLLAYAIFKLVPLIGALLTNVVGIFILMIVFLVPLIIGLIYSLQIITRKKKKLSTFENILVLFPLFNWFLIGGFILFIYFGSV